MITNILQPVALEMRGATHQRVDNAFESNYTKVKFATIYMYPLLKSLFDPTFCPSQRFFLYPMDLL